MGSRGMLYLYCTKFINKTLKFSPRGRMSNLSQTTLILLFFIALLFWYCYFALIFLLQDWSYRQGLRCVTIGIRVPIVSTIGIRTPIVLTIGIRAKVDEKTICQRYEVP